MRDKIQALMNDINAAKNTDFESPEEFRLKYLSKKGPINQLFDDFRKIPPEEKRTIGKEINTLKIAAQQKYELLKSEGSIASTGKSKKDLTLPSDIIQSGSRHPVNIVRNEISSIFEKMGFVVEENREIEDDWHNFTALNFPPEHPARDMQDTFFIEKDPEIALRTHTSSVQIRLLENGNLPLKVIMPGRVFRNEAISARSHCIFHQIEGLYVDENVSFADLKQVLMQFAKELFSPETKIRLRPSYFPFTEPSAEMDISCNICAGKGCPICKHTGWVEILGCGMVDPAVLENCNIDSKKYTGYAFGIGIERLALVKYHINDIRLYFENDIRFIKQFKSVF